MEIVVSRCRKSNLARAHDGINQRRLSMQNWTDWLHGSVQLDSAASDAYDQVAQTLMHFFLFIETQLHYTLC